MFSRIFIKHRTFLQSTEHSSILPSSPTLHWLLEIQPRPVVATGRQRDGSVVATRRQRGGNAATTTRRHRRALRTCDTTRRALRTSEPRGATGGLSEHPYHN